MTGERRFRRLSPIIAQAAGWSSWDTPPGTGLPLLLCGADQHLNDCHVPRPGNDVGDVRDVFGCYPLPELGSYAVEYLGPVMVGQFRRGGARLRLWSARRGEFRELVASCMRADYSWARPGLQE